jgi:hypothetical protein
MIKKMFAICLLLNIGLFQSAAIAANGGMTSGPGGSSFCGKGYTFDPYEEECFKN